MALNIIRLATFAWGSIWGLVAILRLLKGRRDSILFAYLVCYILFIVPLSADVILGLPQYKLEPGFWQATRDDLTVALYCAFIFFVPPYWLADFSGACRRENVPRGTIAALAILGIGLALPLMLLFFAPEPALYSRYGFIISENVSPQARLFHRVISATSLISILCGALTIASAKNVQKASVVVLPFIGAAIWVNGKRHALAIAVFLLVLAFWYRGSLRGKRLIIAAFVSVLLLGLFSAAYQSFIRDIDSSSKSAEELYDNVRMDYDRESRLQMVLFAELYPSQMNILEYRGQSLLFLLTAWVPRSVWAQKPYPYAVYFTSAIYGQQPSPLGWTMTTSLLDESVSNFSWFGLLLGPWAIKMFCRRGDRTSDPKTRLLTALLACLMLSVEIIALVPLLIIWCFMVMTRRIRLRLPFTLPRRIVSVTEDTRHYF